MYHFFLVLVLQSMGNKNKTKDWSLVQNAALVIDIKELKIG